MDQLLCLRLFIFKCAMSAVLQLLCVLFRWFLVRVAAFDFSELRSVFDEFVSCVLKEEKTIDFDHRAFGGARPRQLTRTCLVYKEKLVLVLCV